MNIDLNEEFPLLSRPPIVEAVLGVNARAETPWEESPISEKIRETLPEYPIIQSAQQIQHHIRISTDALVENPKPVTDWRGLRCESADNRQIAVFNRDSFSFSRLKPYQEWKSFYQEGMRLWELYCDLAQPVEAQRIGLRFINKIEFPLEMVDLDDYLQYSPQTPHGMDIPLEGFFQHNVLTIPGHPYNVNVIQTIEPSPELNGWGVIIDIDVFTKEPILNIESIEDHLTKMRWIKNKVFFGSITSKTLEKIK